jgi:hypothetical protein
MNLKDFFKAINVQLDVRIYPDGRCCADGNACDTLDTGVIRGEYGVGSTPAEALADYARLISGKRLVVSAWDKANRKEYDVPNLVSKRRAAKKKKKISRKRK